jgi:ribosome-associated protein
MEELLPGTERSGIDGAAGSPGLETVRAICALLEEHRAAAVTGLDLRGLHIWTDFFIIATVSSGAHCEGLLKHIKEFAAEHGISLFRGPGRQNPTDGWRLVDMGALVIHLMSPVSRSFYELERLWDSAETIYKSAESG